jgi:hypothetical protein
MDIRNLSMVRALPPESGSCPTFVLQLEGYGG